MVHGCTVYTECTKTRGSDGTMDLWVHGGNRPSRLILPSFKYCLISSDVGDILGTYMREHGSVVLYVHGNHKVR